MTQKNEILDHLLAGNTLTSLEALYKFGCFRLGARIWDLRQASHDIVMDFVEVETRRGKSNVARYRINECG